MHLKKITPLLVVDRVETCLALWNALGFKKTVEVPHGDGIGFVILTHAKLEVMIQSRASLQEDAPAVAAHLRANPGASVLYADVDSFDEARSAAKAVKGGRVLIEDRSTPYGAREHWRADPEGNVLGLALPGT